MADNEAGKVKAGGEGTMVYAWGDELRLVPVLDAMERVRGGARIKWVVGSAFGEEA